MSFRNFIRSVKDSVSGAKKVMEQGLSVLSSDITIAVYPLFVFLLVLITIPTVNGIILAIANGFANESIFAVEHHTAKVLFVAIAVVVSAIYSAMMLSYFSCVLSALTLSELDGHHSPLLKGISLFAKRFKHATKFALVSILFIPLGIIAQRDKLKKFPIGTWEVIGGAFSLSTAQLAPLILSEDKGIFETIRLSLSTLGKGWRENLVIKVASYLSVILITILIGFLPILIQSYWFDSSTAQAASKLVVLLLALGLLITAKVLGTVFTTTLYWRIVTEHGRRGKLIE
jgi:hypothetical protein